MHLQNQAGAQALGLQAAVYAHHGQLMISAAVPWMGCSWPCALAQAAPLKLLLASSGSVRRRPVQRCYIAVFTALLHGLVQIFLTPGKLAEIVLMNASASLTLTPISLDIAERADAVHDAED